MHHELWGLMDLDVSGGEILRLFGGGVVKGILVMALGELVGEIRLRVLCDPLWVKRRDLIRTDTVFTG